MAFRRGGSFAGAFRGGETAAGLDPGAVHLGNGGINLPCIRAPRRLNKT
jgi:hypothetical protein